MFSPPYTESDIKLRQSRGDATLLVVVDGRNRSRLLEAYAAIFPALIHMGLPYRLRDLADGPLSEEEACRHRAVVLAQEGVARALTEGEQTAIMRGLERGVGMVSFDPTLARDAGVLAQALGVTSASADTPCSAVVTADNDGFVTYTRRLGHELSLIQPVPLFSTTADGARAPLCSQRQDPVLLAGRREAGRFVIWCVSAKIWLNDYLGHANGLDDVFWRSLVWAAAKPFAMKAMPPFVTVRLDDCQGIGGLWWNVQQCLAREPLHIPLPIQRMLCDLVPGRSSVNFGFQYIDVLNKHGYIPELGLFIDQVSTDDRRILKQYADAGKAEFSVHAFSEYSSRHPATTATGDVEGTRYTEFLYHRGWHQTQDAGLVVDEYRPDELERNFFRADRFWAEVGIRPGRVVNSHYVNPGANSLPFLKARGQDLMMFAATFGGMYDSHYKAPWSRAPYGGVGMVFDYLPIPEGVPGVQAGDFFCAEAHAYNMHQLATTGHIDDGNIDFTVGTTMKGCVRDENDLKAAAEAIVAQVQMGLDSLFFGCAMAHEQGLAVLTVPELDEILSLTDRMLSRYDMLFASYEHIAQYAKCKVDSHLESVERKGAGLQCRLSGRATVPLQLYHWRDSGDGCSYTLREVPEFAGGVTVELT